MGNSQGKPVGLDGQVSLNHFRLLRVVGRGAFGKVRIVERKDTGLSFALKYIRKDEIIRSESVRNIIRERRMLEHVNHPFICNLRYSFQDIEYMYLVVDLMTGGDLRFHISRKTFTEEAVRFWIAELGCALRYVHGQGIIHRDVKPDNVLLDADGHVHLTDFNVATDVVPGRLIASRSGTLAYLGPEVYAGKGYDVRADWWSLGVVFYECIYNKRPFEGSSEQSLSQAIQAGRPRYPITQPPVSVSCMYAIMAALDVNPDTRLGSTWESFTQHEFFQAIDFVALEQKYLEPIFVPSSEKTNFDATYDLEELLLEEAPLEARARRQKPRERLKEDATDKEIREDELYRMIESEFKNFDYTVAALRKLGIDSPGNSHPDGMRTCPASTSNPSQGMALTTDATVYVPTSKENSHTRSYTRSQTQNSSHSPPTTYQQHIDASQHMPGSSAQSTRSASGSFSKSGSRPPPVVSNNEIMRKNLAGRRIQSSTGGVQVTLDGHGSWSTLARQDATLPADAGGHEKDKENGGVFGFFSRKKGRSHSPKPRERGVLGKEGARQIIG
ncbi:Serine/threonine-protein kinase 32A [Ceratocystis fimbriata CBS 114723]|uniref:Serine/threonine-protein kinase 32A n=1 Tax=Ceratocystis fimbriata CBS 114723 TaxID=1035309 RepID=A0A2C5X9M8_9PEZI|nr:Serine/threonine-protein kinase 32A [Ceratocystis fimbriata CBS 114723]